MRLFVALILALGLNNIGFSQSAVVKINIVRGESFVTPAMDGSALETVFEQALQTNGYRTHLTAIHPDSSFFVDVFAYQYAADLLRMTVTVRTKNGIHYLDQQALKVFLDREAGFRQLAQQMGANFPQQFDTSQFIELSVPDLLIGVRTSFYGSMAGSISMAYQNKYCSTLDWQTDEPPFLLANGANLYLFYCANLQGIRKITRKKPIRVNLRIGSAYKFEIISIDTSISLSPDQVEGIHAMVNAFPLWIVEHPVEGITLSLCSE